MAVEQTLVEGVSDEIALSWRRSEMCGLSPTTCVDHPSVEEVNLFTPLLLGAIPVLQELENDLRGTKYSTLLVDRDCRVVRRWCDDPRAESGFDALNVTVGASLLEDNVGTNALGTAFAARRAVTVNGEEHFAESLRAFSCYGHPIRHPLTKRIEGVLDISVLAASANPLLRALISRAVREIELRLQEGSRVSERRLMLAFQSATAKASRAVVAVGGDDVVLSNRMARDLLSTADMTLLQVLVDEGEPSDDCSLTLQLESGADVQVDVERVVGAQHAAILRLSPARTPRRTSGAAPPKQGTAGAPQLITGAPGTGRTTRARELAAASGPPQIMRPAYALLEGGAEWARQFTAALSHGQGSVVVDGIDLLPDDLCGLVMEHLQIPGRPELIFTSGPVAGLTGRAAALAATAVTHDELVPLSARRQDIPTMANRMLVELDPERRLHFTPGLLQMLAKQPWPGNLHELRSVVSALVSSRSVGALTTAELPARYQHVPMTPDLSARDIAERDVIVGVLQAVAGNKVKAAERLAMSRTTLYARMRTLKITTY